MNINTEEELEDFVLPQETEADIPEALKFAPWHRPRKHYIRTEQWGKHIQGVLQRLQRDKHFRDGRPFRYMTLPGPDLIDVRMVADICGLNDVKLSYLGFCRAGEDQGKRLRRNITEFELVRKDTVLPSSRVVQAHFQDVQRKKTEAFVAMSREGTYDAINIDACDPLANGTVRETGRLIDAIRSVTEYQISERREPWVLFLTTPVQIDSFSEESLQAIQDQISQNVKQDNEFSLGVSKWFKDGEELPDFIQRSCSQNGDDLLRLVSLGVGKWLIHLSEQLNFRVKVMTSYCYSVFQREPFEPNMVSLCFLFEPTLPVIQDQTGLTGNQEAPEVTTLAISDHIRALNKLMNIENVDDILANDSDLNAEMIKRMKSILRPLGYPVDDASEGYDAWLRGI